MELVTISDKKFIEDNPIFAEVSHSHPCHFLDSFDRALKQCKNISPHLLIIKAKKDLKSTIKQVQNMRKGGFRMKIVLVIEKVFPEIVESLQKINVRLMEPEKIEEIIQEMLKEVGSKKINTRSDTKKSSDLSSHKNQEREQEVKPIKQKVEESGFFEILVQDSSKYATLAILGDFYFSEREKCDAGLKEALEKIGK